VCLPIHSTPLAGLIKVDAIDDSNVQAGHPLPRVGAYYVHLSVRNVSVWSWGTTGRSESQITSDRRIIVSLSHADSTSKMTLPLP
jgi:hypothetical protein